MTGYYSLKELKGRGWTDSRIRQLLGREDTTRPNPFYKCAADMRFWETNRVEQVENSDAYKAAVEAGSNRQRAAKQAVKTKWQRLMDYVEGLEITVPEYSDDKVLENAIAHYNAGWMRKGYASRHSDGDFLQRITVNYLRHELTSYETELEAVFGKVGVDDARDEIRRKVYDAIEETYPHLAAECKRQLEQRRMREELRRMA